MKLNPEFVAQTVGGSTVLVPVGGASERFHGVLQLNRTAAFIVECLRKDVSEAQIKTALEEEYEATDEEVDEAVRITVAKLQEYGAIIF